MAGLDPAIQRNRRVSRRVDTRCLDGRLKDGHDELGGMRLRHHHVQLDLCILL